jgi:hypothetical protein
MKNKDLIRIGTSQPVNESELDKFNAFDLAFRDFYELVYIPDYWPWQVENGTFNGALRYLINDISRVLEVSCIQVDGRRYFLSSW